jgi:hypothetical protein
MTEFKDASPVDALLSLDLTADKSCLLLTLHFESNTAVRFPMSVPIAMQLWAVLDKARTDHGWPAPTTPISIDQLQ